MARRHHEKHHSGHAGWLRAMVLGSNDAIVSTASLMIGVAASAASRDAIVISGVAGPGWRELAVAVAEQLTAHDQLGAHLRDELGIDEASKARPFQAAWTSAISFAVFA